jgi:TP901 family phage tail tape measure protein
VALSSRELLLILRARDEASRVVRGFAGQFAHVSAAAQQAARNQISMGSALVSVGVGIGAVGVATLAWLKGSTDAAVEFNKQVAYTSTQLGDVKASMKQLGDTVKGVGRDVAVPIEQLHAGLYDIFSSMNVNLPQAQMLLRTFAKEAVAGQVELKEASRATIGILNAFHLKVEDVTRVQDVQFQLVRKGVGTYEEFARVMGRATPSASRAGQSVEVLAGMLAYLTRNGLSAAMASASAARAFDAFAHPKTVERLKAMGIEVTDAQGNFRKFTDVIVDLQRAFKDMTAPERASALQDLFKGSGGTIQARRFYDAVLKDKTSVDQFVGLVGDMENAHGAFEDAYTTMADTTASKSQLIANRWQLMRVEIGEALVPALERLMDIISAGLKWWNSLDEGLRKQIITWIAIGSVIAVAVGVMVVMAGGFLMLAGAAAMAGISLGALLGIFAAIIVGIAAIIVVIILLVKNWEQITQALARAWNWLWNSILKPVIDWIWSVIGQRLVDLWKRVSGDIIGATRAVGDWIKRTWDMITGWTQQVWPGIKQIIEPIIDWFVGVWPYIKNIIADVLRWFVDTIGAVWTVVVAVFKGAWTAISGVIQGILKIIMGIIDIIVGIFTLNWEQAWNGIKEIFSGIWDIIVGVFKGAWQIISGVVVGVLQFIGTTIGNGLNIIWNIIRIVLDAVGSLWNHFWQWVSDFVGGIFGAIKNGVSGFWDVLKSAFRTGVDILKGIWNGIMDVLATPVNFVIGIIYTKGIKWLWDHVADLVGLGHMPDIKQLDAGVHFARGGPVHGPGGPRDDAIMSWLSNGEYVVNARKTAKYRPLLDAINYGSDIPGFAEGGVVGQVIDWVGNASKEAVSALTDPVGYVTNKLGSTAKMIKDIATVPVKLIGSVGSKLWDSIMADQQSPNSVTSKLVNDALHHDTRDQAIHLMQRWSNQQKGKTYLWGAVGPEHYDCSGLVGNLWAMVMGKEMYRRYFTTSFNPASFGFVPGPGMFTMYLGPGHMAADLMGMNVEAYNGDGTPLAIGRIGTPRSYFTSVWNMFANGGFVDMKNNPVARNASWLQHGWPEPAMFDGGGIWRSGTLGLNMSGRDELVLDPDKTRALLGSGGVGGTGRGGDQYFYITTQEIDPRKHAAELGWEIRHGRVV